MSLEHGTPNMPKMVDGKTDLDEKYFNLIHGRVDQRLAALEELRTSWESATDTLTRQGLTRIDEVLAPAFQKIEDVLELGFMTASSATSNTLVLNDELVFIVDEGARRELFQPTAFLAITRVATIADYALARLLSYDSETGALTVEIISVAGNPGPHTDWEIGGLAAATVAQQAILGTVQTLAGQVTSDKATVAADKATTVTAKDTAVAAAVLADASKVAAAASAAAAATFNPANFYTTGQADSAISTAVGAEATARTSAISTAVAGMAKTSVAQQFTKPQRSAVTSVASATTITIDLAANNDFEVTAYAHTGTLANPTNQATQIGQKGSIAITQDGSGGHPLAFASNWKPFGQSTAPSINTTAGVTSVIDYHVISATVIRYTLRAIGA